jgi:hypothetical protein
MSIRRQIFAKEPVLKHIDGVELGAYLHRLRLLREIISGDNQADFARRLGIPPKRWNNYERGFPLSREIAFMIWKKFPGMSPEWIWFGAVGNLSKYYRERIKAAELLERETEANRLALEKAQKKFKDTMDKRKKALSPPPTPRPARRGSSPQSGKVQPSKP